MIKKISPHVLKINLDSNMYFLDIDSKILVDTGNRFKREFITKYFAKVIDLKKIEKVIFTHLHYDHIGNADLFPNAKFFASKKEIESFNDNPELTVLNKDILSKFKVRLNHVTNMDGLQIITTPGHTVGSICLYYWKEGILFSGDTFFGGDLNNKANRAVGRTDLPTSKPEEMEKSLEKLKMIKYKILAPGHDYYKEKVL